MKRLVPFIGLVSPFFFVIGGCDQHVGTGSLQESLHDFQSWKKANEEPFEVAYDFSGLCIGSSPEQKAFQNADPHRNRFLTVYVNPTGEAAMQNGTLFPVGSILVKEKRVGRGGRIELYTVMKKREKGYNPSCGDWEFAVLDAEGKLTESGKLKNCMECHERKPKTDYAFRSYLDPSKARAFPDRDWIAKPAKNQPGPILPR